MGLGKSFKEGYENTLDGLLQGDIIMRASG
jgi:hypothetical protein